MKIDRVRVSATTSINGASGEIALGDVTNMILPPRRIKVMYSLKSITKRRRIKYREYFQEMHCEEIHRRKILKGGEGRKERLDISDLILSQPKWDYISFPVAPVEK